MNKVCCLKVQGLYSATHFPHYPRDFKLLCFLSTVSHGAIGYPILDQFFFIPKQQIQEHISSVEPPHIIVTKLSPETLIKLLDCL